MPPPTRAADYRMYDRIQANGLTLPSSAVINASYPVSPTRAMFHAWNAGSTPLRRFVPGRGTQPITFSDFYGLFTGNGMAWLRNALQAWQRGEPYRGTINDAIGTPNPRGTAFDNFPLNMIRTTGVLGRRTYRCTGQFLDWRCVMVAEETASSFTLSIGAQYVLSIRPQHDLRRWVIGSSTIFGFNNVPAGWVGIRFPARSPLGYYWAGGTVSQLRDKDGVIQTLATGVDDNDTVNAIALLIAAGPGPDPGPSDIPSNPTLRFATRIPQPINLTYKEEETKDYSIVLPRAIPSAPLQARQRLDYFPGGIIRPTMLWTSSSRTLSFKYGKDGISAGTYSFSYWGRILQDSADGRTASIVGQRLDYPFTIKITKEITDLLPAFADCTPTGGV